MAHRSSEDQSALPPYEVPTDPDAPLTSVERALVRAWLPVLLAEIVAELQEQEDQLKKETPRKAG